MVTRIRSLGVAGAEYQSVMITPPNGSADCSGMKDSVSRVACHRKEFTPSVTWPEEDEMAVAPLALSATSLSSEPQAASSMVARRTVKIRIVYSLEWRARHQFVPRGAYTGGER